MRQHVLTFIFCCLAATAVGGIPDSVQWLGNLFVFDAVNTSQCVILPTLNKDSDDQIDKHPLLQDSKSNVVLNRNATKTVVLLALSGSVLAVLFVITGIATANDYQKDENGNKKALNFKSFSLRRNVRSLLSVDQTKSPNEVLCLHGMRTICTFSIIYLHSYFYRVLAPVGHKNMHTEWAKTEVASRISSLNITVDTFFVISALLLTNSMLKDLDR